VTRITPGSVRYGSTWAHRTLAVCDTVNTYSGGFRPNRVANSVRSKRRFPTGRMTSPLSEPFLFSAVISSLTCCNQLGLGVLLLLIIVLLAGRTGRPWGYPSIFVPSTSNVLYASLKHALQRNGLLERGTTRTPLLGFPFGFPWWLGLLLAQPSI